MGKLIGTRARSSLSPGRLFSLLIALAVWWSRKWEPLRLPFSPPLCLTCLLRFKAIYQMASTDINNFHCVYGLLFFGVPNRGILTSHWMPIVNDHPNETLVRNLAPDSIYLRSLHDRFGRVFGFPDARVVSIYETSRSKTAKVNIPVVSGTRTDLLTSSRKKALGAGS